MKNGEKKDKKSDRATTPIHETASVSSQPTRPVPSPKRQLQSPSVTPQPRVVASDSWLSGVIMKSLGEDLPQPVVVPNTTNGGGGAGQGLTSPSQKSSKRHYHVPPLHHPTHHQTSPQHPRPASNSGDRLTASPSTQQAQALAAMAGIQTKDLILQARSYAQNSSPAPPPKQAKMSESQVSPSLPQTRNLSMEGMGPMNQQAIMNMIASNSTGSMSMQSR